MSQTKPMSDRSCGPEWEALARELLSSQLELGKDVTLTSQFLKGALAAAHANLAIIQTKFAKIQQLVVALESSEGPLPDREG